LACCLLSASCLWSRSCTTSSAATQARYVSTLSAHRQHTVLQDTRCSCMHGGKGAYCLECCWTAWGCEMQLAVRLPQASNQGAVVPGSTSYRGRQQLTRDVS
jgi:hypothetical protein